MKNNVKKTNITAVIITMNEEENIRDAVLSVSWTDEVIVVDSGSSDKTVKIARSLGAKVFHHKWSGYVNQKNWANKKCKTGWILSIDADERVTPELRDEILERVGDEDFDAYNIPRLAFFLGKWIRRCHWYPDHQLRLFKKARSVWTGGEVHEKAAIDGKIGYMKNDLLHYTYKNIEDQTNRLNRYSTLWAKEAFKNGKRVSFLRMLLSPVGTFINIYFLRLGFLEGYPGLVISNSLAYYSFQKKAKLREMRREAKK